MNYEYRLGMMEKYIIKFRGIDNYRPYDKLRPGYYCSYKRWFNGRTKDPGNATSYRDKSIAKRTVNRLTKEIKNNRWRGIELKQYSDGSYFVIVRLEPFLQTVYSVHVGYVYPDEEFNMEDVRGLVFVQETFDLNIQLPFLVHPYLGFLYPQQC